ncbi:hypothetical protein HDF16_001597 [Granulicella aggregans]|uniref:Toprim domain-containing protein n=1 Tax=Granulicella aggregans TaxID=474949 RepID=A0A7W8E2V1_9BACT|nr:hypothetical protein [Granulicella aggregans]
MDLIEQVQHVDFTEADRIFREFCGDMKPGTPPPPAPIITPIKRPQVPDEQIAAWQKALSEECREPFSAAGNYLHRRGIAPEIAERLSWGFDARSESIVIPRFHSGELVGVKFRKIEPTDDVKWTQVKGSSKCDFLYGCDDIMDPFADLLFIAEGEHEKALLKSLGVEAVAILGTAGVPDPATLDFAADLKWVTDTFSRVVLIPDSDPSGQQAMERLQKMLADFPVTVATLPGFKDFGDFYQADNLRATEWLEELKKETGNTLVEHVVESLTSSIIEPETYPLDAWDGTEYAEFARRCSVGNHITQEYFIESLKTVTGAIVGSQLRLWRMAGIEARFYTANIGGAGSGKSTATGWALGVFPHSLLYSSGEPRDSNIGCFVGEFGSGTGLVETFAEYQRILIFADELSQIIEKFSIGGSGQSFLSNVNTLFDSSVRAPSNITRGRKASGGAAHLSILANTTPDKWDSMFQRTGAVGSGLFSRLNLVVSDNTKIVPRLQDPDLTGWRDDFIQRVIRLEKTPVEAEFTTEADAELEGWTAWLRAQPDQDADVAGRLGVQVQRNALHLAWLLDRPAPNQLEGMRRVLIDKDIIARAIKLAKYQYIIRCQNRPSSADNVPAHVEAAIKKVFERKLSVKRSDLYKQVNGVRFGLTIFDRAVQNLIAEGYVTAETIPTKGRRSQTLSWIR